MSIYEKNLEFFKNNLEPVYNCLMFENSKYDSKINIIDDPLNLIVENNQKKCFIHSTYNVNREIENMLQNVDDNTKNLVVFGLGCGYLADYINTKFKSLEKIVIIEPDLNLFKSMLEVIDIVDIVNKLKNVTFIINKNENDATNIAWDRLSGGIKSGIEIVYNISYRTLYSGYFEAMMGRLRKYLMDTTTNIATFDYFLHLWPINILKNLREEAIPLDSFIDKFNDIPAIVVSAGPSLNKNMHLLKEVKDKAVIVAVGSAIKILHGNNIVPHFRFAFDGGEEEKNIFNDINTENSTLVFGDELYNEILPEYKGKKIRMVLSTNHLVQYINRRLNRSNFTVKSGFSIANVALDALIKLGIKKIIFMGQDLCYTEGNLYARGSWMEETPDFSKEGYIKTKDIFGQDVYTIKGFLGMKNMLEQSIKLNANVEYINATEGGLPIEGTKIKYFNQVIEEDFKNKFNINDIINNLYDNYNFINDKAELYKCILEIDQQLNKLININGSRLKLLKKIHKFKNRGFAVDKLLSELNYVKKYESELEVELLYKEAIIHMISSKFDSISANFYYTGNYKEELFKSTWNSEIGKALELQKYLNLLKSLITEFIDNK